MDDLIKRLGYKLNSPIPGVTVELTSDPACAKIHLTDSAKREIALMIAMKEMEEDWYSAKFYLSEERLNLPAARQALERLAKRWFRDGDDHEASADAWLKDQRVQMWFGEIDGQHAGDCTALPCSCGRCQMEEILGVNTFPFTKHVGARLSAMSFDAFASAEQKAARQQRDKQRPLKAPDPEWVAKHQPIWDAQKKAAQTAWDNHQSLVDALRACSQEGG